MENILICQDIARNYHKQGVSPRCMMKLDIRKAYDTLEWQFLQQVLSGLNFPPEFINWIMTCLSTVSFSIALNGRSYGFIKGKRGLRQGDPMSLLLFVVGMEYLSRLLQGLEEDADFKFHPKCGSIKLNHLCFADDLMIVCKADSSSPMKVKAVVEDFGMCSGLCINPAKSHIFLAGVEPQLKQQILERTQFSEGTLPVRYLGIPLISTSLKEEDCQPIITSIKRKLNS